MKIFKKLQKVGKALMIPVSVLPAAGILVAIGRLLAGQSGIISKIGELLFESGMAVFENLPLIFALGVAIGFTSEAIAALAAGVGYLVYTNSLDTMAKFIGIIERHSNHITEINTGVFGGIIIGVIAAKLYTNFHETELPPYLGFFAGKRLVPIITAIASLLAAVILSFIWPPVQIFINQFARFVMKSPLGPAFYAAGKRALIPVGLHHVYYPPFLYEFGRFTTEAGEVLRGDTARYFAGDPTAGYFMASEFPLMLFGLPAACLAMYLRAKPSNKKAVAGAMTTAALTSVLTGITEPIEFSFIFIAPLLYIFHIFGAFLSGLLTKFFEIRLGYTFSASIIDYVLGISNAENQLEFWLIVGPIIGVLYFVVFYITIPLFDFKTPGRAEKEEDIEVITEERVLETEVDNKKDIKVDDRTQAFITALGGIENIEDVDACVTRLRLSLVDDSKVDDEWLEELGAVGVVKMGGGVQVMIGPECVELKDKISKLL
ncbi:PTS system, glucose-like IIB component [Halobacteroides halobius DSM 5150]|uniref:PTS system, glucose-like IIB component n=1 Tax=Halobacteroides halobius (strain ATCC 35273 / DSM 5150 / MD-1) TaxID=748449 RepID=L0KBD8_HALHC|nr:PTS transporter subunit EIIC [Halobacteroides halobius]AGB41398.1 PTS system, glucose-like IIB component [Halobacteroides halobius DSM 5150]